jgi:hypothetical protein
LYNDRNKKYISEGSKILTDEYVRMMIDNFVKSPLENEEFLRELKISNKEQAANNRRKRENLKIN